jgi:hypothetical protein
LKNPAIEGQLEVQARKHTYVVEYEAHITMVLFAKWKYENVSGNKGRRKFFQVEAGKALNCTALSGRSNVQLGGQWWWLSNRLTFDRPTATCVPREAEDIFNTGPNVDAKMTI